MIEFILNNQKIKTEKANGLSLLDFIRKEAHLMGTKSGCREGDCGACTVLEGSLKNRVLTYKSIVSCLTPLINAHGKHIVTIEGLNLDELSPVQKAMKENAATQCGFCTPGFVVALTGHLLSKNIKNAKQAVSGNICRCTGYKSIEKAAHEVDELKGSLLNGNEFESMIERTWLPEYFSSIKERLEEIKKLENNLRSNGFLIGGGTDIMVQQAERMRNTSISAVENNIPNTITFRNGKIKVGAAINMTEFFCNEIISSLFPSLKKFSLLIASEQIRNMGTLAGNIVNASPIGGLSVLFLALGAELILETKREEVRIVKLADFFLDYKKTILERDEIITHFIFSEPKKNQKINFEKISKRTYLDIASVNSAICIETNNDLIENINFSAGGVAPIPKLMRETNALLKGKKLEIESLELAIEKIQSEIKPISDVRGSDEYKRLLLRQLFLGHFLKLFPDVFSEMEVRNIMITNNMCDEKY